METGPHKREFPLSLRRIAQMAGVSKTTVSKALLGYPGVAPATRDRIKDIADHVGYHPQASARALATGRTETIGLVSPGGYNPHIEPILGFLGGMVDALERVGYRTTLFHMEPAQDVIPPAVLQRAVDGMVLLLQWTPRFLDELRRRRMPRLIAMPLAEVQGECDVVRPDDVQGARLATRHLLDLGHRRIAYIPTWFEVAAYTNRLRWNGYVEEMSRQGLPVYPGGERARPIEAGIADLFEKDSPPTALVCFNDLIARMAIDELRERALEVPRDVSVVGFDDSASGVYLKPRLTTVRVPFRDQGAEAARMILKRLETPEMPPQHVVLEEELIVRDSTAPPRADNR